MESDLKKMNNLRERAEREGPYTHDFSAKKILPSWQRLGNDHAVLPYEVSLQMSNWCPYQRSQLRTAVGINDIGGPCLRRRSEKSRRVDFRPNSSLAVERSCSRGDLRDVHLHRSLVAARDGVFARALGVLMPLKTANTTKLLGEYLNDIVDIRDVGACGYSGRVDAGSSETIDVACEVRGGDIRNGIVVGRDTKEGI
jgi:hypothetical protein